VYYYHEYDILLCLKSQQKITNADNLLFLRQLWSWQGFQEAMIGSSEML